MSNIVHIADRRAAVEASRDILLQELLDAGEQLAIAAEGLLDRGESAVHLEDMVEAWNALADPLVKRGVLMRRCDA